MSRRQQQKDQTNDGEEVELKVTVQTAEPLEGAADQENSYQNHMLIYHEDIDSMLDDLDDDWESDDENNTPHMFSVRSNIVEPQAHGYRYATTEINDYPEPPPSFRTMPAPRAENHVAEDDDEQPSMPGLSPPPAIIPSAELPVTPPIGPDKPVPSTPETPTTPPNNQISQPPAPIPSTVIDDTTIFTGPILPPSDQPMPRLMGARAPMSRPAPIRRHGDRGIQKASKLSKIKALLENGQKGAKEVFDILIRSIKLDKNDATMNILKALEQIGEDLCDKKYREKESTASLLHVALLYQRIDLCKKLINMFPGLLKLKYTSDDYRNQTCFHIAAANDERGEIIYYMLNRLDDEDERRQLLNTIADGDYFIEERPEAATCLSAAVWTGQVHMIMPLVDSGADLDVCGNDGNTLLHYIIYLSTTVLSLQKAKSCIREVYNSCNDWWMRRNRMSRDQVKREGQHDQMRFDGFNFLLGIRNNTGLIPLSLAVSIHSPLTPFLLNFEPIYKLPHVKFGAVAWATYDVTDILSYKQNPEHTCVQNYDGSSVFHILAHTQRVLSKEENTFKQTDIAELEPINSAILMKWSVFRWLYIVWCLVHTAYMVILTTVVLDRHNRQQTGEPTITNSTNVSHSNGTASQVLSKSNNESDGLMGLFLVIPVIYVIFEMIDLIVSWAGFGGVTVTQLGPKKNRNKLLTYLENNCTITGNAPYRMLAFCFSICMFAWYGMFIQGNSDSDIPLSLAFILGWIFMLNFTRACRHVCRFSIMIQKMFFRDFLYFLTVYMFILIAFSSALHLILAPGQNVGNTFMSLLNIVTNAGDAEGDARPDKKHYAAAVLSMYAILSVILLLNMLIAMMNTSYDAVKSSKTNLWRYQQLSILLMFERRFIWWKWVCLKSQSHTKRVTLPKHGGGLHSRIFLDVTEEKMK